MENSLLILLPSLCVIVLALLTRKVLISLFVGVIVAELVMAQGDIVSALLLLFDDTALLFSKAWVLKTAGFMFFVGALMYLFDRSGAVSNFVHYLTAKMKVIRSQRGALFLVYGIGVVIFIESSITSLISGAVGRPFCDKHDISREKLAYICDSTSAPICSLLVFNGWGALLLGILTASVSVHHQNPVELLIQGVVFNFYAFAALLITFLVIYFNRDFGPMKQTKAQTFGFKEMPQSEHNIALLLLPLIAMIALVFAVLFVTGEGNILKGSGSSAIFYSLLLTLLLVFVYYVALKRLRARECINYAVRGAASMQTVVLILLLAILFGQLSSELKSGEYLTSLLGETLSAQMLPLWIFLLSSLIAFSTGTSWGTFSIMLPIGLSLAAGGDASFALCLGAVISGGVFGDHCSPISDTTIISSMAAGCDTMAHVKTQLPYALVSGAIAACSFFIAGVLL